jgi:predicted NBD/HSP70 family sugar kinase
MANLWGVDLGGTKIEGVVLDASQQVLARLRVPTEREKGYDHIIGQIRKVLALLEQETGLQPDRLGIGTPGTHDPQSDTHKNSNTTALNGQPFCHDLQKALNIPVRLANDANCFALAEARLGACQQLEVAPRMVFGVIMGTGVGGGLVIDGQVWNGHQGIAGEWGHNFLDESGGTCYCGRVGCVETMISGPALERYYARVSADQLPLTQIIARAANKIDPFAEKTVERLIKNFGRALAAVINTLDPDAIVLGGGLSNIGLLYREGYEAIQEWIFNPHLETPVLRPVLGDSAGVIGAALLWEKE